MIHTLSLAECDVVRQDKVGTIPYRRVPDNSAHKFAIFGIVGGVSWSM